MEIRRDFYKSRAGKLRNFLQLSDNDVEFCRNVVQATASFVLVSLCVVLYTVYISKEHIFIFAVKGGHICIRYSFC